MNTYNNDIDSRIDNIVREIESEKYKELDIQVDGIINQLKGICHNLDNQDTISTEIMLSVISVCSDINIIFIIENFYIESRYDNGDKIKDLSQDITNLLMSTLDSKELIISLDKLICCLMSCNR